MGNYKQFFDRVEAIGINLNFHANDILEANNARVTLSYNRSIIIWDLDTSSNGILVLA